MSGYTSSSRALLDVENGVRLSASVASNGLPSAQ